MNDSHPQNDWLVPFLTPINHTLLQRPSKISSPKSVIGSIPKTIGSLRQSRRPSYGNLPPSGLTSPSVFQAADFNTSRTTSLSSKNESISKLRQPAPFYEFPNLSNCNSYSIFQWIASNLLKLQILGESSTPNCQEYLTHKIIKKIFLIMQPFNHQSAPSYAHPQSPSLLFVTQITPPNELQTPSVNLIPGDIFEP